MYKKKIELKKKNGISRELRKELYNIEYEKKL